MSPLNCSMYKIKYVFQSSLQILTISLSYSKKKHSFGENHFCLSIDQIKVLSKNYAYMLVDEQGTLNEVR